MFDLAGGHRISGTWRSHAPFAAAYRARLLPCSDYSQASGLHDQRIVGKKRDSVLWIIAEMFDLAGGHRIIETWRSHAPMGKSNSVW